MAIDPITAIFSGVTTVINKIWPDASEAQKAQLQIELAKLSAETDLLKGQQSINLEEAKSASLFVAGWRPCVGWICAAAFGYHFILLPLLAFGFAATGNKVDMPAFDMDALNTVLMGMLGIGGLRSFDKLKGTSR